jgi:hypothetical protein
VVHTAHTLVLVELELLDLILLQSHDQFFAVPHHLVREVGPLELRLIQHLLRVGLFLLQHHQVLLQLHQFVLHSRVTAGGSFLLGGGSFEDLEELALGTWSNEA